MEIQPQNSENCHLYITLHTFQLAQASFLCRAFVLGDVLMTTRARISSFIDSSSGDGPDSLMEYSR